jgi:hypothetical protein
MSGGRRADPPQRLGVSGLGRTEIKTSLGTTGRVEQEGLALAETTPSLAPGCGSVMKRVSDDHS